MLNMNTHRNFATQVMKIMLPDLGVGTKEATVKEWYVKPGQVVEEFDDLVEVYTDKLVAKIPSTYGGVVKSINFSEDDVCPVGHALLTIEVQEEGEETPAKKEEESSTSSSDSEMEEVERETAMDKRYTLSGPGK